jgi:hypothetical protein
MLINKINELGFGYEEELYLRFFIYFDFFFLLGF